MDEFDLHDSTTKAICEAVLSLLRVPRCFDLELNRTIEDLANILLVWDRLLYEVSQYNEF